MSLLLSPHYFSLSSKTPLHHRHNHRKPPLYHLPKTLISTINHRTTQLPIYATAKPASNPPETLPQSAIQRIAEKLRSLGFVEEKPSEKNQENDAELRNGGGGIGEIFIPNSRQIPVHRVGHTLDSSWSTPHNPVPEPGSSTAVLRLNELKRVVKAEKRVAAREVVERDSGAKAKEVPTLAELTLKGSELRRLRKMAIEMKQKMKLGKAGVTEGIVNGIHERWRSCEIVKIVVEDICRLNMKRTHDLLERKTGGMVVWRAGGKIVLYRGVNYVYPYFSLDEASAESSTPSAINSDEIQDSKDFQSTDAHHIGSSVQISTKMLSQSSLITGVGSPNRVRFQLPGEVQLVEEADRLLAGLGPRFTDWWGYDPLPVDADLLPAVVPGYRKPFRLLPYGVKSTLTNDEMTILKRLGRPLPCHFALGRNRNHQGLAAAILKLWEKSEIAKIAVKRGVQNTNSELMAVELKRLTGGVLLSRDKDYIVFYRGKDFLPAAVSSAIQDRRKSKMLEEPKLGHGSPINAEISSAERDTSTASEGEANNDQKVIIDSQEQKLRATEAVIVRTNKRLTRALEEKERAEKLLAELEQAEISRQAEVDKEGITEEEKYMLRKVGLKMKPFLLLGRRGVFDGTIENMHLHWKYRELVKIICGGWNINEIHNVARTLEAESGGILVAVERISKGHAIIVYRGKNYQRPASLRPQTLLNKKEALKRSIEAQRRQSLKLNVLKLSKNIEGLKLKLVEDKETLDEKTGSLLISQLEMEQHEVNSDISDDKRDSPNGSTQEENLAASHDTREAVDELSMQSDDIFWKKQTTTTAESSLSDYNPEAICSEMSPFDSSVSANASFNDTLYPRISKKSNPTISSEPGETIGNFASKNEIIKPAQETDKEASVAVTLGGTMERQDLYSNPVPIKARVLTNKERLLLRKQALKMKKRPVLAVGRSNVVTGVAKAIKDHFKKYPLAIVNVKGRAKGTSVQEVIFKLEQETGSILVSQEPSKVILYRGWGGGVDNGSNWEDRGKGTGRHSLAVSPELMEAMRLECGLLKP